MWCCKLWGDAVLANASTGAQRPKGLRLQDSIITEDGKDRRSLVPLYNPGTKGAPDMLVTHCPFCGTKLEPT